MDHLLLHYEVARFLWDDIFNWTGVAWVMPRMVVELFGCWKGLWCSIHIAAVWKMVSHCIIWCLDGERCFEDFCPLIFKLLIL